MQFSDLFLFFPPEVQADLERRLKTAKEVRKSTCKRWSKDSREQTGWAVEVIAFALA